MSFFAEMRHLGLAALARVPDYTYVALSNQGLYRPGELVAESKVLLRKKNAQKPCEVL